MGCAEEEEAAAAALEDSATGGGGGIDVRGLLADAIGVPGACGRKGGAAVRERRIAGAVRR